MEFQHRSQKAKPTSNEGVHTTSNAPAPVDHFTPHYTPQTITQLQRTIGNKAVGALMKGRQTTAANTIQRDIIVQNVDFDPTPGGGFSHGFINLVRFPGDLKEGLKLLYGAKPGGKAAQSDPYAGVRPDSKLNAVITHVTLRAVKDTAPHYMARDIPALALLIATDIEAVYKANGVGGGWSGTLRDNIKKVVQTALLKNLVDDYKMQGSEKHAFKQLIQQAGAAASREKEAPTPLTMAKLGGVAAAVQTVHTSLVAANNQITRNTFPFEFTNEDLLRQDFSNRNQYYQGNHTNNAEWLPTRNLPANWLPTVRAAVLGHAAVTAIPPLVVALQAADAQTQVNGNAGWQAAYTAAFTAASNHNDAAFKQMAWLALGSGVSAYIEFAIPGHGDGISRLIYDFVGNNFYVTAHYKWSEGYNPFFHITDLHL